MRLRTVASILVAGLAACSSGGSLPSEPSLHEPPGAALNVPLRVFIPTHVPRGRQARGLLHQHFIATNSAGIAMAVYPHGLRLHQVASLTGNISSSSPACKIVPGGRACSFALSLPPGGPYDFVLKTYDQPPAAGAIPHTANQLGAAVDTAKLATGKANTLHLTVGGVVARTFIHIPDTDVFHAIASRTQRISIGAVDADGNLIASDAYVDASGSPVTITPSVDTDAGTTVTFSPAKFSAPQVNGVTLQYSALAATEAQLRSGFYTVIRADTGTDVTSGKINFVVLFPGFPQHYATDAGPYGIVVAAGTWIVSGSSSHSIDTLTNPGSKSNALPPAAQPYGLAADARGGVWFTEAGVDQLGIVYLVPGSSSVFVPGTVTLHSGAAPVEITNGPDGAMWFTEQGANAIARVVNANAPDPGLTEYPLPTKTAGLQGITTGPDGALWFAECSSGKIGRIPLTATAGSSAQIQEFTISPHGTARPLSIVAGADGALWFTDNVSPYIRRITTNGVITSYSIPSGAAAGEIAIGPDGAMWFTEPNGSHIGRILTSATTAHPGIVEFGTYGSSVSSRAFGITVGADGSVYYTEYNANEAVQFQ